MNPTSPYALPLAPLPATRFENSGEERAVIPDGFVDDEVIALLISASPAPRITSSHSDLVLSSDENDFAGWSVPSRSPFRVIAERQELQAQTREAAPEVSEPGLGLPHRGGHRWWIAAATGVSSALILSFLFSSLASRTEDERHLSLFRNPVKILQAAMGSLAP